MPTYSFVNTQTNEEWEDIMSMSDKETYLNDNPHIKSIITAVNIIAGTGGIRNDSGWTENMQRIAEAHPTSEIANNYGDKGGKATKTRAAVDKWRKKHRANS